MFWKVLTPLFSGKISRKEKITLVDGEEIITKDKEVCETFNEFFKDAMLSLDINENKFLLTDIDNITDPVQVAIKKFEIHPSILEIQNNVIPSNFSFSEVNIADVENKIKKLTPKGVAHLEIFLPSLSRLPVIL